MERLRPEVRQPVGWFGFPEQRGVAFGNFDVLSPEKFLPDLQEELTKAKQRIWIKTMHLEDGKIAQSLLESLRLAVQRGVNTMLHIDSFSTLIVGRWYLPNLLREMTPAARRQISAQRKNDAVLFKELEKVTDELVFTNPARGIVDKMIPFRGRDHRKVTIIDNLAYMGGLNYFDLDFQRPDFTVKIEDPAIVLKLAEQFDLKLQDDLQIECNSETDLLVDCGKPKRSLILDHAVDLVGRATEVLLTSQYIPDGVFLRALDEARRRGAKVQVITSSPSQITEISVRTLNEAKYVISDLKGRLPPVFFFYPGWVHAKLLIAEVEGVKTAIFGSHNFSQSVVDAGTAEIALQSTNPQLVSNLESFFQALGKNLTP